MIDDTAGAIAYKICKTYNIGFHLLPYNDARQMQPFQLMRSYPNNHDIVKIYDDVNDYNSLQKFEAVVRDFIRWADELNLKMCIT